MSQTHTAASVKVEETATGKEWKVVQSYPPEVDLEKRPGNWRPIEWAIGPIEVTSYIEVNTREFRISRLLIGGISVGSFEGNVKAGMTINVLMTYFTGTITIYEKGERHLWNSMDLYPHYGQQYQNDFKVGFI